MLFVKRGFLRSAFGLGREVAVFIAGCVQMVMMGLEGCGYHRSLYVGLCRWCGHTGWGKELGQKVDVLLFSEAFRWEV